VSSQFVSIQKLCTLRDFVGFSCSQWEVTVIMCLLLLMSYAVVTSVHGNNRLLRYFVIKSQKRIIVWISQLHLPIKTHSIFSMSRICCPRYNPSVSYKQQTRWVVHWWTRMQPGLCFLRVYIFPGVFPHRRNIHLQDSVDSHSQLKLVSSFIIAFCAVPWPIFVYLLCNIYNYSTDKRKLNYTGARPVVL